jgi:hypothetical protein
MLKQNVDDFSFLNHSNNNNNNVILKQSSTAKSSNTLLQTGIEKYTKKDLVNLHAKLIQAQIKARSTDRRWKILIERCINCLVFYLLLLFFVGLFNLLVISFLMI